MGEYEIRIMENGHTRSVIEVMHLNDNAAVRAGMKFAAGKHFEVWRGLDCVYGSLSAARERLSRSA